MATGGAVTLPPVTAADTTTSVPVATTTEPPTEVTTTAAPADVTTAATTTTPPPSGVPVDASIPLLVGGGDGSGWLSLGAWDSTDWSPPFTADGAPIDPTIAAGSTLAITGLQAGDTTGVTGDTTEACFDGSVGPTIDATVGTATPPGFGYSAVALPAIWPLHPRPVVVVEASIPAYEAAGQAVFADDPVDASLGTVEQIVLADLDGDGDEEALVSFEHVDESAIVGAPGDLSAILLIATATGTSTTVVSSFVGPLEDGVTSIIDRFRVLGVADLNGDGRMEVVVHSWYYEGAGAIVFEYDGTSLNDVLSTGCGA